MIKINTNEKEISNPNNKETFNKYLTEITKYTPFSREEEVALFKRIEANGDEQAIDMICKHNLRFVISVAKKYAKLFPQSVLTLEDLVNEGNIGLWLSIKKFDYKTGNKFISYAVWLIRSKMLTYIQHNLKSIAIPINAVTLLSKSRIVESKLEQILERNPTTDEVLDIMIENGDTRKNNTVKNLEELMSVNKFEDRLNRFIGEDDSMELGDLIKSEELEPQECLLSKERKELMVKMFESVPQHIMSYISDFYGLDGNDPLNLKEIGEKHGVSSNTIKLRIDKTLRRIRYKNRKNREIFFCDNKDIY